MTFSSRLFKVHKKLSHFWIHNCITASLCCFEIQHLHLTNPVDGQAGSVRFQLRLFFTYGSRDWPSNHVTSFPICMMFSLILYLIYCDGSVAPDHRWLWLHQFPDTRGFSWFCGGSKKERGRISLHGCSVTSVPATTHGTALIAYFSPFFKKYNIFINSLRNFYNVFWWYSLLSASFSFFLVHPTPTPNPCPFLKIKNTFFQTVYSDHGFPFLIASQIPSLPHPSNPMRSSLSRKQASKQTRIKQNKQEKTRETHACAETCILIQNPQNTKSKTIVIRKRPVRLKKSLNKTKQNAPQNLWVNFVLGTYCWAWAPPLSMVCIRSKTPSERSNFSLQVVVNWR